MTQFITVLPELFILAVACLALMVDVFFCGERDHTLSYVLVQLGLIGGGVITMILYAYPTIIGFDGSYILDRFSCISKLFIYIVSFAAFLYSRSYIIDRNFREGEFYVLGLFTVLGMMVLVSSYNFITLYLGLELSSLPLYAMIAIQRKSPHAIEAALKYFILGALASGLLLYGMSMLYGATGSIQLSEVATAVAKIKPTHNLIAVFGLVFIVVGIAFKFGTVPFHMWAPDVYEGAPTAVVLFISGAPKIAAFAMAVRLLMDAMPSLHAQWQQIFLVVALLSMGLGNIAAIMQSNLKRMLAYSSIAHMGYMSLGILAASKAGFAASSFYVFVYSIMAVGGFGMIVLLSKAGFEAEKISDFRGLNSRDPWLAFMMLLLMFSMAGIPPTVGFFAKILVFESLIRAHLTWVAAVALVFAVIGSYYYLYVVKVMYFDEPDINAPITASFDMRFAISVNALFVLALGLFPSALVQICLSAFVK